MNSTNLKCKDCSDKSCAVAVLNEEELELLSSHIAEVSFDKGERLFKQDSLNAHVIYMKKGLAKVHMKTVGQKDYILKIATPPSYLGLPTIFGDCINQYSATALESTTACFIDIATFKHLIYTNGEFAFEIIEDICKDELCNFRRYVNQTHKQTPGRLAGALIYFSERVYKSKTFKLSLTRYEIAEMIGTSRESVTRNLTKLKEGKIIDIQRDFITILKPKVLNDISEFG